MREQRIKGEEAEVSSFLWQIIGSFVLKMYICIFMQLRKKIQEKSKEGTLKVNASENGSAPKRRGRWDQTVEDAFVPAKKTAAGSATPTWGDGDVSFVVFQTLTKFLFYVILFLLPILENSSRSPLGRNPSSQRQ